ncbi:MAG: hypothetical protein NVSMB51_20430 [Solirubrobacteraceae bacterium]
MATGAPRVSIVIPTYSEADDLRRCLTSIRRDGCRTWQREVIVVLNGLDTELRGRELLGGVRTLRSPVNLGYGGGCNLGAAAARGEFLVFLNDDIEVHEGWLDALVQALDEQPWAGIAGARVLSEDGSLQEAGAIIWSDGLTHGVGRGAPPGAGAFRYRRVVDYCSGCALIVRRTVWDAVGGFDERYAPAYYEDVDLCLGARALGHATVYEPAAEVTHREHGTLAGGLVDLLNARNLTQLRDKWAVELRRREAPPAARDAEIAVRRAVLRARGFPRQVLMLTDRLPDDLHWAGAGHRLRTLRELGDAGFAPSLLALESGEGPASELGRLGVEVVREDLECHLARPGISYEAVIVSGLVAAQAAIEKLRRLQPAASLIYDAAAVHAAELERGLAPGASGLSATERRFTRAADAILCAGAADAERFRREQPACPVAVAPPLDRGARVAGAGYRERRGVLLRTGSLARKGSPEVDGLYWFAEQVLPRVEAEIPWVLVSVAGAGPPAELRELAGPTLRFEGRIADLHARYDSVRAAVVPVRGGPGGGLAAIDAISYGVPLVSTSAGLEGLALHDRSAAVDRADDAAVFADALVALLSDRGVWEARRAQVLALRRDWAAGERFPWAAMIERLRAARSTPAAE